MQQVANPISQKQYPSFVWLEAACQILGKFEPLFNQSFIVDVDTEKVHSKLITIRQAAWVHYETLQYNSMRFGNTCLFLPNLMVGGSLAILQQLSEGDIEAACCTFP